MSTVNDAPLVIDSIRPGGSRLPAASARANQAAPAEDEASFWDLLDIINPLQHIPVVSTIYREITGDTIKPIARLAGGALFGGLVGAGFAAVSTAVEGLMGLDEDETMLAFLFGGDEDERPTVEAGPQVAKQAIGLGDEDGESPAEVIARYAQPVDELAARSAQAPTQAAVAAQGSGMPSSAALFMAREQSASTQVTVNPERLGCCPRSGGERPRALPWPLPAGVMPATAASLKAPEMADRSREKPAVADAVQRALEAQGLGADAASHPMIQALVAKQRPAMSTTVAASGVTPQTQGPQQMPSWFDQAMMQALDRYEQTAG